MSLTKDCYLPPLIELSKPASFLASIAFKWDEENKIFKKMGPTGQRRHKITTYIHGLSMFSMAITTALFWEKDRAKMLISSFGLIVLYFTLITVWVYHRNVDKTVYLINELIRTSEELQKAQAKPIQLDVKEKFVKFMAPLFHWSAMSVPFAFVGGVVWSMPCLNSSFAYYALKECHYGAVRGVGDRSDGISVMFIAFILINLLLWSYSIQCAVFAVIGVEMLGAMTIRSFLKHYRRIMLAGPWNVPSPSTSSTPNVILGASRIMKTLFNNALIFRRIQILTDILNEIHSVWVLVPLLFTVSSHQVFSLYGAIKFNGQLNFMSYALFFILANQGFLVIMGMFTALGDVFRMSLKVKMDMERAHRGHKWLRRFHRGCKLVKIRFGKLNYVDSMTPLMFENFALAQAANMLIAA